MSQPQGQEIQGAGPSTSNNASAARRQVFFNPESPQDLIAKFRKELGKTLVSVDTKYTASGCKVTVTITEAFAKVIGKEESLTMSAAEYLVFLKESKKVAPKTEEKKMDDEFKFVVLYEKRLGKEFPRSKAPASFDEASIKRWILQQPFEDRKVLSMNAKQFRKHSRLLEEDDQEGI